MDKDMDWIYGRAPMDAGRERTLEAVEKALGFKLFVWQKTISQMEILDGTGRLLLKF